MAGHEAEYLFRGTTRGWPGNDALQREGITCTTTDPLVATLFAIECRNNGAAIILAARWDSFSAEERSSFTNHFWLTEHEVVLRLPPVEFERRAEMALDVDRALVILEDIGFEGLPIRIPDKRQLQLSIDESHALGQRLNPQQIRQFLARMPGGPS